jgi:hypothetical protein
VGEELEATWAKMFEVKDREAIRTPSGRIVGDSDGEFRHVGGERGEVPVQGALSPNSTYKAAGGWVLGVRSDGGEIVCRRRWKSCAATRGGSAEIGLADR